MATFEEAKREFHNRRVTITFGKRIYQLVAMRTHDDDFFAIYDMMANCYITSRNELLTQSTDWVIE